MKVHLAVNPYPWDGPGESASICGMNPRHGTYDIRTTSTFFHAPIADQCTRCVKLFRRKGNNIQQLRDKAAKAPLPTGAEIRADRKKVQGMTC